MALTFDSIPSSDIFDDTYEDPNNQAFTLLDDISRRYAEKPVHGEDLDLAIKTAREIEEVFTSVLGYYQTHELDAETLGIDTAQLDNHLNLYRIASVIFTSSHQEDNTPTGKDIFGIIAAARLFYLALGTDPHQSLSPVYPDLPDFLHNQKENDLDKLGTMAAKLSDVHVYFFRRYAIEGNSEIDTVSDELAEAMHSIVSDLESYLAAITNLLRGTTGNVELRDRAAAQITFVVNHINHFAIDFESKTYRDHIVEDSQLRHITVQLHHAARAIYNFIQVSQDPYAEINTMRKLTIE